MEAQAFAAASEQLSLKNPEHSARWGMNAKQRMICFSLTIGFVVWLWLAPTTASSTAAIACLFGVIIAMRCRTVMAALMRKPGANQRRASDADLPMLSILVPLDREADIEPQLIGAIARLDYPPHLLDVTLLDEADDPETIPAAKAQPLPAWFEVIPSHPVCRGPSRRR